jgi:hypothetical protein
VSRKSILVSAVLGFCLWLAGGEVLAQPGAIKLTVNETAKEGKNKGEWDVTTEVKNTDTAAATVVFWSWPAAGVKKIGDLKWHPAGTESANPDSTKPDHKIPKATSPGVSIPAGGTLTMTETRKEKPGTSYVRVFKKNATGAWEQANIVAHNVHLLAFNVPNTNPVSEYLTLPVRIPYATDLANATNGAPLDFFVKSVSLPPGWQTTYLAPALGERFTLQSTQREFSGVHVVRMTDNPLVEGQQAVVNVTWGVEDQDGEIIDYEVTIKNLVVKDNTPPVVSLVTEPRPDGTFVRIDVSDPGGIHHNAQLLVTRNGSSGRSQEILVVPFTRVLAQDPQQEIGATHAQFETTLRSCGQETLTLVASAVDQFGNSAVSGPVSTTVDADAEGIAQLKRK